MKKIQWLYRYMYMHVLLRAQVALISMRACVLIPFCACAGFRAMLLLEGVHGTVAIREKKFGKDRSFNYHSAWHVQLDIAIHPSCSLASQPLMRYGHLGYLAFST